MQYSSGICDRYNREVEKQDREGKSYIEAAKTQAENLTAHKTLWQEYAGAMGTDYLMSAVPMMDMTPTERPTRLVIHDPSPRAFRRLLRQAKQSQQDLGLRKFIALYAWNEWFEGGYIEPSTQFGHGWLKAIEQTFGPQEP